MGDNDSISNLIERLKRIRIEEARVIDLIEQRTRREAAVATNPFRVGDRVRVTDRWRQGQPSTATVTKINGERTSIRTDDGTETWRLSKNLARLR